MSVSFDFQIISSTMLPGVSLIVAQNEDSYDYLVEDCDMTVLNDGAARIFTDEVGDFISDAAEAHLCCDYL